MSTEPKCELSNHDLAHKVVVLTHELAKTKGQSWMLSIPVNFNKDPDILFIECADRLLTATAQLAAKDAEIERLKLLSVRLWDSEVGNNPHVKKHCEPEFIAKQRAIFIKENNL